MQHIDRKNVIIGAGAMGSAAAYHLARRGEPVLLIEQFALGHDRGSSRGAARITRHSYADANYAQLMPSAFQAWKELEADAGQPLYIRTGGVSLWNILRLASAAGAYSRRSATGIPPTSCPSITTGTS